MLGARQLVTNPPRLAKGNKQKSRDDSAHEASSEVEIDPHDLTVYQTTISHTHENLKSELARVKVGGTVRDLDGIEGIRVRLGKSGGATEEVVSVGDVASVVPRGKSVQVILTQKEVRILRQFKSLHMLMYMLCMLTCYLLCLQHVKPVTSALAQPPQNLNTQISPTDPLTLTLSIPPITQDARVTAAAVAAQRGDLALSALREARGAQKKKIRAWELSRKFGQDVIRRAEKEMEKVNEIAVSTARKMVDDSKKRVLGR